MNRFRPIARPASRRWCAAVVVASGMIWLVGPEDPRGAAAAALWPQAPTPAPREALDPALVDAGESARALGFAAARARLEPLVRATADPRSALARVQLGLLAHAADDPAQAVGLLEGATATTALDDWRLYVLADSAAAARPTSGLARAALAELLERHPDSPLRADAIVRLAELAWDARDADAARARVAQGRSERLPRARAVALEKVAWQIALAGRDAAALRGTARRLLVLDPLEASRLRVVDVVASRGGGADWRLWLDAGELARRADALLEADLPAGALTTLAAVPEANRDLAWRLLEARALVAAGRGAEAFSKLAAATAGSPAEQAELDWQRSRAAAAAAEPAGGRALPIEERVRWRRVERDRLLAVARAAADPTLERRALRRLAASHLEEGRSDEAIAAWRQLAATDPADASGARPLWDAGWEAYRGGDPRRAIALWHELAALYPKHPWARSGAYWSARAHERLGQPAPARDLYLAVLGADTLDFYARQAALRLAGARAGTATAPAPAPWPTDAALARAERLSDLGLDALAATELELVGERAELRPRAALAGLVAARSGATRDSLRQLKRAFPELGTAHQGTVPERALALYYPLDFRDAIAGAAAAEGLPASLVFGMVHQESGFDPAAQSRSGARGLMQLMPSTGREVARRLGLPFSFERLEQPDYSLRLGTSYFRRVLGMFGGRVELALAGYNGGPGRISRLWRAEGPSPELDRFLEELALEESRNYVKRIVVLAESYRSLYPDLG